MKRQGLVQVSFEALAMHLGLTAGHAVKAVVPPTSRDVANDRVTLLVTGPDMPEHHEGEEAVRVPAPLSKPPYIAA